MAILSDGKEAGERFRADARGRSLPTRTGGGGTGAALRMLLTALCIVGLCSFGNGTRAQTSEPSAEYLLKAAFLYNFAKFVEWPDSTVSNGTTPFTICVLGSDPFGPAIDALTEKSVKGRPIDVKRQSRSSDDSECHVLFVSRSELAHSSAIITALKDRPVLTVCDADLCAQRGLMINLRTAADKIQLDINLDAVQRTPLKVSSQLLKLARLVKSEG